LLVRQAPAPRSPDRSQGAGLQRRCRRTPQPL